MARAVGQVPTQADKRRSMTLKDRHGREYYAVIEKASGAPTGLVQPLFQVPHPSLIPPQQYMKFPEDRPGLLDIDYAGWESDARAATEEWEQNRAQLIAELPGGKDNPMLPRHLGPRPTSPLLVRAMRQGNRWTLGLTDKKPPEAEAFFPTPQHTEADAVFTETDVVFTEESVDEAGEPRAAGVTLSMLLDDVMKRCPPTHRGAARRNWAMQELERMARETSPAGAGQGA
jgi:hypothetical protein